MRDAQECTGVCRVQCVHWDGLGWEGCMLHGGAWGAMDAQKFTENSKTLKFPKRAIEYVLKSQNLSSRNFFKFPYGDEKIEGKMFSTQDPQI